MTLNDVRNGGPYAWSTPHTNLPGDGNGDLMDGHCNGTEDPYDGSAIFDMTVSDIPYAIYDLIIYMGAKCHYNVTFPVVAQLVAVLSPETES